VGTTICGNQHMLIQHDLAWRQVCARSYWIEQRVGEKHAKSKLIKLLISLNDLYKYNHPDRII
jgi:hypothetical protein